MKTKLLSVLICILCMNITISDVNAQQMPQSKTNYAPGAHKKLSDSEKKARAAKKQQESRANLAKEYGLSMPQILQIESMRKQKNAQISNIKKSNISKDTKKSQIKVVVDTYMGRLKSMFTPSQYAKYEAKLLVSAKKTANKREIIKSYKSAYAKIKKSQSPQGEKTAKKEEAKNKKVASVQKILPQPQFEKWHKKYLLAQQKSSVKQNNNPK